MKKQLLKFWILILTLMPIISMGQTFSVSTDTITKSISSVGGDVLSEKIFIGNLSGSTLSINWIRTLDSLPVGWTSSVNTSGPDYPPFISNGSFSISVADSGYIQIYFATNNSAGTGIVDLLIYDANDSINNNQLVTFILNICEANKTDSIIDKPINYNKCLGANIQLDANGYYSYTWSNGSSGQSINYTLSDSLVSVIAMDNYGCEIHDTLVLDVQIPYNENICIVTIDSNSGHNLIVWEKTLNVATTKTNIYKETTQANVYSIIGSVLIDSLSSFIDTNSNSSQISSRYKITTIDSCGNESDMSQEHKTIHLTVSQGTGSSWNLIWDGYEGFTFPTYNIWRGTNSSNMVKISSVQSTLFTYTDLNPPAGTLFYQIEVVKSNSCIPTKSGYISSVSNIANTDLTDGVLNNFNANKISVFPNPTNGLFTLKMNAFSKKAFNVRITNHLGQEMISIKDIKKNLLKIDISNMPNGIYFISLTDGTKLYNEKIILER